MKWLTGADRRRDLPVQADEIRGRMKDWRAHTPARANHSEKKSRQLRDVVVYLRGQLQIGPRVDIVFDREKKNPGEPAAVAELGTISVLLPANAAQQDSLGGPECDEITAAAMVRTEDQPMRTQLRKRLLDIRRHQRWAIATNRHHFAVAQSRQRLDGALEALREITATLWMETLAALDAEGGRTEDMDVGVASDRQ